MKVETTTSRLSTAVNVRTGHSTCTLDGASLLRLVLAQFAFSRDAEVPVCAPLQTVVFSKQQGCITKLRLCRDSHRIIALHDQCEHRPDILLERSQASQDVLLSFRNALLHARQEGLRHLHSGRSTAQKLLIIACSAVSCQLELYYSLTS